MKTPKHLYHKPIVLCNDYDYDDRKFADKTDVKALSIGKASYDAKDISLKVWRKPKKRWSRQSEGLPIHRNLELTILLLSALTKNSTIKMFVLKTIY